MEVIRLSVVSFAATTRLHRIGLEKNEKTKLTIGPNLKTKELRRIEVQ